MPGAPNFPAFTDEAGDELGVATLVTSVVGVGGDGIGAAAGGVDGAGCWTSSSW